MTAKTNVLSNNIPDDPDIYLWRYMDLSKLIALLNRKKLYFPRADLFLDPYERAIPIGLHEDRVRSGDTHINAREFAKFASHWKCVSCWHMNPYESAAMWKLYTNSKESVAIRSTYNKLVESFPESVDAVAVQYIDYEDSSFAWPFGEHSSSMTLAYKRKSFEHENEVRFIVANNWPLNGDGGFDVSKINPDKGMEMPIDVNNVIEEILISPEAEDWIYEVVRAVVNKFGFSSITVTKSKLYELPA